MIRILLIMMLPFMCLGQITPRVDNPVNNGMNEPGNVEIKRKSPFNLDEIKVRWKKAALENCPGVPCVTTTVPAAPTGVSAIVGNASASVAFTAPTNNGGSAVTGYTVTSNPGSFTGMGSTSPINVTGLVNGTAYTFTVVATNVVGNSVASTTSTAVTPVAPNTVPAAPTGVSAIVGNASASVAFTAPTNNGGSAVTGYTVTSSPGGITATGASSPINVTGLANGTAYTFTVVATNVIGNSVASNASTAVSPVTACGAATTVTDVDNNSYNTVSIRAQCWLASNLKVTKYNDGITSIPLDVSVGSGTWSTRTTGAYTIYDNESSTGSNATNYGFLYNWYAAKGIETTGSTTYKNICPTGWHVPTDVEWSTLIDSLGGFTVAGGKMKSTDTQPTIGGWNSPNSGATNESGFSALPGGYRFGDSFLDIKNRAFIWSATENGSLNAFYRTLVSGGGNVSRQGFDKVSGFSIRCLKD